MKYVILEYILEINIIEIYKIILIINLLIILLLSIEKQDSSLF